MTYMSSNSTSSGQSSINVNFDIGTDVNIAALDVQNRVSVAQPTLPDIVKRLGLTVRKRNPSIMWRWPCIHLTERTMPHFRKLCQHLFKKMPCSVLKRR